MQISFSISTNFTRSYSYLNIEGGWQCTQDTAKMSHFSMDQDIVDSIKGDNTDQSLEDRSWEIKEQKFMKGNGTVKTLRGSLVLRQK